MRRRIPVLLAVLLAGALAPSALGVGGMSVQGPSRPNIRTYQQRSFTRLLSAGRYVARCPQPPGDCTPQLIPGTRFQIVVPRRKIVRIHQEFRASTEGPGRTYPQFVGESPLDVNGWTELGPGTHVLQLIADVSRCSEQSTGV